VPGTPPGPFGVEDQLGPEEAAHRRVRAGLRRLRVERWQQRENHDQVAAPIAHPAAHGLQVPEVAQGPAARRTEGGKLCTDPPAPVRPGPTPRFNRRGDDRARLGSARSLDREPVVAQRKAASRPNLRIGELERGGVAVFEEQLRVEGTVFADREGNHGSVPCDENGRKEPGVPGLVGSQRFCRIAGAGDGGAERRADAKQRLGRHGHRVAQTVGVMGVDTHRFGKGLESFQIIHARIIGECRYGPRLLRWRESCAGEPS